ncbi:MAG: UDP-N-acetylmuramate dehydrogenase [Halothiobacillaceae bacterium]
MSPRPPCSGDLRAGVPLESMNSFRVAARAEWFARPGTIEQLQTVLDRARGLSGPLRVIGHGTNVLIVDDLPGVLLQPAIGGIECLACDADRRRLRVGAGESWHALVRYCMEREWPGLENLALIPGTVGAAPVQNIGAYGRQFSDFCLSVTALDRTTGHLVQLPAEDCQFGYRDSRFRRAPGRWIITAVELELPVHFVPRLDYPGLRASLGARAEAPDLRPAEVAEAVERVRRSKLPDLAPDQPGSAGSFFKNPVVSAGQARALNARWPDLPSHPVGQDGACKLSAAWMIEATGWKGCRVADAGVYDRHALVLVNHGQASGRMILELAASIRDSVRETFGVTLEPEPLIWPEPARLP